MESSRCPRPPWTLPFSFSREGRNSKLRGLEVDPDRGGNSQSPSGTCGVRLLAGRSQVDLPGRESTRKMSDRVIAERPAPCFLTELSGEVLPIHNMLAVEFTAEFLLAKVGEHEFGLHRTQPNPRLQGRSKSIRHRHCPPEKSQVKVRLNGIDTPEKGQAFGAKSANFIK